MGKESEKEYIYIYIYIYIYKLSHFAVYLKLTQYCKSTILPYKIKNFVLSFSMSLLGETRTDTSMQKISHTKSLDEQKGGHVSRQEVNIPWNFFPPLKVIHNIVMFLF